MTIEIIEAMRDEALFNPNIVSSDDVPGHDAGVARAIRMHLRAIRNARPVAIVHDLCPVVGAALAKARGES